MSLCLLPQNAIPVSDLLPVPYETNADMSCDSPVITPAHADYINGHLAHEEHSQGIVVDQSPGSSYNEKAHNEKAHTETIERV